MSEVSNKEGVHLFRMGLTDSSTGLNINAYLFFFFLRKKEKSLLKFTIHIIENGQRKVLLLENYLEKKLAYKYVAKVVQSKVEEH